MEDEVLRQVEQIIGYKFSDRDILRQALTHSSSVDNRLSSNERLEFLGDAVLGMVICRGLYKQFPHYLEGDLTKIKSMLVSRRTGAAVVKRLGLQQFLTIGKGMRSSRALTGSVSAGLLEAIIGAVYVDGGYEHTRTFVLDIFADLINKADAKQSHGNFKSILQQYAQQNCNVTPDYELVDEKGPDHDKCFECEVVISGRHFPSAWGRNKKEAEQKAAFNALKELDILKS